MSASESRAQPWCVRAGIWLGLVATLPLGGCSLLFVDGPPKTYQPSWQVQCTTSNALPVVDVLLASFQAYRTGSALSRSDADYQGAAISRSADITAGLTLFTLAAVSAGVGFSRVSDCKEAIGGKELQERDERRRRLNAARNAAIDPNAHPSLVSPGPPPGPMGGAVPAPPPARPAPVAPSPPAAAPVQQKADEE